jgi:hypothetical protein
MEGAAWQRLAASAALFDFNSRMVNPLAVSDLLIHACAALFARGRDGKEAGGQLLFTARALSIRLIIYHALDLSFCPATHNHKPNGHYTWGQIQQQLRIVLQTVKTS